MSAVMNCGGAVFVGGMLVETAFASRPVAGHTPATGRVGFTYLLGGLLPRPPPDGLPVVLGQFGFEPPLLPPPPFPPLAMFGSFLYRSSDQADRQSDCTGPNVDTWHW